mgnify:CR=1 FL=1
MAPMLLSLLGLWATCIKGPNSGELYLTYFTPHERVEAYVVLSGESCTPQARDFKAALVTRWSYQLHGDEIQQTLLSEQVAFFDSLTAKQQGADVVCGRDEWMESDATCLRNLGEFAEYERTRESLHFKNVKATIKNDFTRLR